MAEIKFIIHPNISDILLFSKASICKKSDNDKNNKIREEIIEALPDMDESYFTDLTHGEQWTNLRTKLTESIQELADNNSFTNYEIVRLAGRTNNYDFKFIYYNADTIVYERNVEFKNGSSSISKLPQFLSLSDKFNLLDCEVSYSSYFYDNYLSNYLSLDSSIELEKPEKEIYLKHVSNTNYDIVPFFRELKTKEHNFKKEKSQLVNESIQTYLELYGNQINLKKMADKLKSQDNKVFMMWDGNQFHLEQIIPNMTDLEYINIKNGNTIMLKTDVYNYHLLLRWRNHKGILNPAWQIKLSKCSPISNPDK